MTQVGDVVTMQNGTPGKVIVVFTQDPPHGDLLVQYTRNGELYCRIVDPVNLRPRYNDTR